MSQNKNQNQEVLVSGGISPGLGPREYSGLHDAEQQFQPQKLSYWQTNKGLIRVIIAILLIVTGSIFIQKINSAGIFHPRSKRQVNLVTQNLPIMNKIKAKKLSQLLNIKKLHSFVKQTAYYDIEYFLGSTKQGNSFQLIHEAQKRSPSDMLEGREELQFSMNFQEIELLINRMMHPDYRPRNPPVSLFFQSASPEQLNVAYFYYELQKFPQKTPYFEAQYYRFDKLYNIGIFRKQLPLCIIYTGRDNQQFIKGAYESIMRQNYTNYRVIHVDDNSDDSIINKAVHLLNLNSKYSDKFTIIRQNRQRNVLHNLNFAIKNYCQQEDIIIQMRPSAKFVGRQAFQLINSLYQAGYIYKGSRNALWATIMKSLTIPQSCCPQLKPPHNIPRQYIEQGIVRQKNEQKFYGFRTYLNEIYKKVDQSDFIDKSSLISKQFYPDAGQLFIFNPIIQMSGVEHLRLLGQAIIHQQLYAEQKKSTQTKYSIKMSKFIKKYSKIKNLMDIPERQQNKIDPPQRKQLQQLAKQLQKKRKDLQSNFINIANNKLVNSIKKSKQQYIKQIQQRKVYNPHNQGRQFGYEEKFFVDVKKLNEQAQNASMYEQYGIRDAIQVGSKHDYLNLSSIINFTQVKSKLIQSVAHQVLTFKYNQSLELKKQKIKLTHFKSQVQMQSFLRQIDVVYLDKNVINDTDYLISQLLARSPQDQSAKQLQYYHLNKKYNIGANKQQIPICVFSSGYKLFTNDRYKTYFTSYQRLNYTNFKIIWVDDYSQDYSAYQIYNYLKNSNMRIKNRIKIIYNLQHLGILANMHIYIQKYCGPDDIVIICDADDGIAGIQTFHILNSLYKDPNNCYVYSRFLMNDDNYQKNVYFIGPSSNALNVSAEKYRFTPNYWVTSHLRTFRKKVMDAVPLQHFVQYHQDRKKGIAWPRYYGSSADRFQIYTHLEICGSDRIKFITDFMLNYQIRPQSRCYRYHELYDEYKSRIKRPLRPLTNLNFVPQYIEGYEIPNNIFQRLKKQYPPHRDCMLAAQPKNK